MADTRPDRLITVYPRWRGEHTVFYFINRKIPGLSPLARGTPEISVSGQSTGRFIPAGAGNTLLLSAPVNSITVYPRWRGEHCQSAGLFIPGHGLSPLARGTLISASLTSSMARFIPAGAGNTIRRLNLFRNSTVYPRWRGEHISEVYCNSLNLGLSPLARGTLVRVSAIA